MKKQNPTGFHMRCHIIFLMDHQTYSYTMNRAPPRIKSVEIHPCKSRSEINLKQRTLASLVTEQYWG
jgi:ureidoglycolate hydrolase